MRKIMLEFIRMCSRVSNYPLVSEASALFCTSSAPLSTSSGCCCCCFLVLSACLASMTAHTAGVTGDGVSLRHLEEEERLWSLCCEV